jgi:hypothetical protein
VDNDTKESVSKCVTKTAKNVSNVVVKFIKNQFNDFTKTVTRVSSDTVEWMGIIALHAATIPTLLGLMMGVTDDTPPIDLVLILWAALTMFFIKAVIKKDILNILTIGLGFIGQATMIALIFFK